MSSSLEGPLSWRTVVKSMITVQCGPICDGGLAGRRPPARRILGLVYPTPNRSWRSVLRCGAWNLTLFTS